ncbi:MAG: fimbrillin family protein [Muribaculaceae bacterium]|nr:fimbrillin family protein [Muribaculaceae bacterium]
MKNLTFLMIAGLSVIGLASCTSDEPLSVNQGNAINFRPAMSSRAKETTNANLSSINVTAFLGEDILFGNTDFVKGSDNFFTSSPEYYWPTDDSELTFYAYSPSTTGGTVTITKDTKTLTDFTVAPALADQIDFITSTATGKRSVNEASGVELTFNHQLSQIEVMAKADNEAYSFEVSGIRIGEPVEEGAFDFNDTAWTIGTSKAVYEDTYSTGITLDAQPVSIMGNGGNAILIPQKLTAWDVTGDASNTKKGAYLSVKLRVTTTETGTQVYPYPSDADCQWAAIPIDTNWEPGMKYVYVLDFSHGAGYVDPNDPQPGNPVLGGPIKFTVDVLDWNETDVPVDMTTVVNK